MSRHSIPLRTIPLLALLVLSSTALASYAQAPPTPATPSRPHRQPFDARATGSAGALSFTLSPTTTSTSVADLVARVDGNRWHADVTALAQFGAASPGGWGTRRTFTTGNIAARDWISATLAGLGWTTSLHAFSMTGGASYDVVAERVGDVRPGEIYIVGAHMDSTSTQAYTLAPGAEDNGSGTAALLEIARVLQDQTPASTIRLIAFSGEEQGLVGSDAYASYLENITHELDQVQGVYIMDMIGYTSDPNNLHVLLESRNPSTYAWMGDLRDHLASSAATYTALQIYTSNGPCCSDHMPFLWRQVPAVLLIGAEVSSYPYYHTTNDLPAYVVPAEGAEIIKAIVAALAEKAGVVCIFADVDCNGAVDVADLVDLANHWRLSSGEAGNGRYDLNQDGEINILDIQLAALEIVG
ncbi:MAG: M20/M25/M40 family metallo-hydrolase [Anaerolineae bacterium]